MKLLIFSALLVATSSQFVDISPDPMIFESELLPQHENGTLTPRYWASVGNGHLSTTVFTDTVFINGLYNGERGESHRARVPSKNNLRAFPTTDEAQVTDRVFGLNVNQGFVYEKYSIKGYTIEHRTFAHRYYNRIIMSQFLLNATDSAELAGVNISFESIIGTPTDDIEFEAAMPIESNYTLGATRQCGKTKILEDSKYQSELPTICIVSFAVPSPVQLNPGSQISMYFLASYDLNFEDAASEFEDALIYQNTEEGADLFNLHQAAWQSIWNDGEIQVDGNLELSKIIYGCLYYLSSSLPMIETTNIPSRQFYGLSPGGLAYGDYLMDYQGHIFWDGETWMFPSILYLYPKAAKEILSYRMAVIQAARDLAVDSGYAGARFPWEGAVTGREVTPDCCNDTRELQIHITSDVSFAVRQYIATTRDINWLTNTKPTSGCSMIREMAEFYTKRVTFNTTTRLHDILGVMPPDEDNRPVDNNPYTNIGAGYAIFFAIYAECLCAGEMDTIPKEWADIASSIKLLYDEEHDYHPEFEGYQFGTEIKQADVVLIGFPQQYEMAASTRRNDLLIYENATRPDGPAMTWAIHTIGFLDLNEVDSAAETFEKSFRNYVREPFKVWTEAQLPTLGAINFITGMGGFLQSIISGYGGYRLYPEKIVFKHPRLPPNTEELRIKGLDYMSNVFDMTVTEGFFRLTVVRINRSFPLIVAHDDVQYPFVEVGFSLGFNTSRIASVEMYCSVMTNCPLPKDKIGVPLP